MCGAVDLRTAKGWTFFGVEGVWLVGVWVVFFSFSGRWFFGRGQLGVLESFVHEVFLRQGKGG